MHEILLKNIHFNDLKQYEERVLEISCHRINTYGLRLMPSYDSVIEIQRSKNILTLNTVDELKGYYSFICHSITRDGHVVKFEEGDFEYYFPVISYEKFFGEKSIRFIDAEEILSDINEWLKYCNDTLKALAKQDI